MLRAGETSGNLDEMADRAARHFEEVAATTVTRATRILGPALLLVVGGLLGYQIVRSWAGHFQQIDLFIPGR